MPKNPLVADRNVKYWRSKPWWERLQAGYHMSLRAYGYDPDGPDSKIDTSILEIRRSNCDEAEEG